MCSHQKQKAWRQSVSTGCVAATLSSRAKLPPSAETVGRVRPVSRRQVERTSSQVRNSLSHSGLKERGSAWEFINISCQVAFASAEPFQESLAVLHWRAAPSFSLSSPAHTQMQKPPTRHTHTLRPPARCVYGIWQRPHEKQTLVDQTLVFWL